MMHLAANTPGPRSWPCGTNRSDRLASASCLRRRAARFPAPRQARSVSRKQSTNFLEFIDAGFHYSVFARDNAAGAEAGLSLDADRLLARSVAESLGTRAQGKLWMAPQPEHAGSGSGAATGRSMQTPANSVAPMTVAAASAMRARCDSAKILTRSYPLTLRLHPSCMRSCR